MSNDKIINNLKSGVESLQESVGALEGLEMRANLPVVEEEKEEEINSDSILDDLFKKKEHSDGVEGISITLRKDQIKSIDKICKITKKKRSEFIRELIDVAIKASNVE